MRETHPLTPTQTQQMLSTALGELADYAHRGQWDAILETLGNNSAIIAQIHYVFASFAHAAVHTAAGDRVGSTNARDYITTALGISNREGNVLIKRGQVFHAPTEADSQQWKQRCKDLFLSGNVGIEKFDAINNALKKIPADSTINIDKLRFEAFQQAVERPVEDLRAWLIDALNVEAGSIPARDKDTQAKKLRAFRFGPQDALGGCSFNGYLPAAAAAVVKQCLAKGADTLAAFDREASEKHNKKISRSTDQYYADVLTHMATRTLKNWDMTHEEKLHGTASLVISVVADEIAEGYPGGFAASNGMWLTAAQVTELLGENYDWLAVHDSYTGFPLALGRTNRSATTAQRIALFANEGTCAYPGCNRSIDLAQAHHITAWKYQGRTDLTNLTMMCTYHHGFNDDNGNKPTRGRVERDETTLETYWKFQGQHTPNRSLGRSRAAGNKIRLNHSPHAQAPHAQAPNSLDTEDP